MPKSIPGWSVFEPPPVAPKTSPLQSAILGPTAGAVGPPAQTPPPSVSGPATGGWGGPPPGSQVVQNFTGFQPKYAMEGFDTAREQNPNKSAKDAFAYLSQQAPPPPLNDKSAMGVWFNTYIKPGMESLGHKVHSVEGDKFTYSNWEGTYEIDFARGAGAPGGALAWQADVKNGGPAAQAYQQTQQAIVGVPKPKVSTTMPVANPSMPSMDAYYQYLQSIMNASQQEPR